MSTQTESVSAYEATRPYGARTARGWDKATTRRVLMIGGLVIILGVSAYFYLMGGRYVGTDDSYVQADKLMVSTDVSGLVKSVNVHEGEAVKKGQILFRIDPQPFQIALENAKATLAQSVLDVESTRAMYRSAVGQISAEAAQVTLAQATYDRYVSLGKANAIAAQQIDTARSTLLTAKATVIALQQDAQNQLAKLNGNPALPAALTPEYLKAKSAVDEAQRQLDHATVRAPFDGMVGEVNSLQPGTLVISAMAAFTTTSAVGLISNRNMWISADMKETDLTHVRIGDPVDIAVDTYPGRKWYGHIAAISEGSDSSFSALPAENGTGNWVKVVQRIPVRIAIDQKAGDPPLRAGMSAGISIDTHRWRWQRLFEGG